MRENVLVERLGNLERNWQECATKLLLQVSNRVVEDFKLLLYALGGLSSRTAVLLHNHVKNSLTLDYFLDILCNGLVRSAPFGVFNANSLGDCCVFCRLDAQLGKGFALTNKGARNNNGSLR